MEMKDSGSFKEILRPFKLKNYCLKNRIVFAPMSTQMANVDGSVSGQMIDYYADKAAGGAAMVITETFHVDSKASRFTYVQPSIYHDRFIPGLSNLADAIKMNGAIAIAQIGHAGRQTSFEINNYQPVAPSKIVDGLTKDCQELTIDEIHRIIRSFAEAAVRALIAGFDGIEIHGGNGYLINQFLSPLTNKRNDEYGKYRELFLAQIINEIKSKKNPGSVLGVRVGFSDFIEGGLRYDDAIQLVLQLPKESVDYIHTSAGTVESDDYRIQPIYLDHAIHRKVSHKLKGKMGIPIILTGSINKPELAEEILSKKEADLIGMGRPLLADPELPKKVARLMKDEVRPCIRCNQGCLNRVRLGKTIKCSVNPVLGHERYSWIFLNKQLFFKNTKTVFVAGGGPAGITAALRASELGFKVKMFEKEDRLGGLLNTSRSENFKKDICDYLDYLIRMIMRSEVEIFRSTKCSYSLLKSEKPHIFINASGSIPVVPPVPEHLPYKVVEARTLLNNLEQYEDERNVITIGGGSVGCEIGYTLQSKGGRVTIIEQASDILQDIEPVSALSLKRLLLHSGCTICPGYQFIRFDREGVITSKSEDPLPADLVVVSMGSRPNQELEAVVKEGKWTLGKNYLRVGDANKVGKIYEAVHETYWSVSNLLFNYYNKK
jgi:2,4-dienoyl-CoA reductase-like NADH-dependent reductase (Old Yellow Enzyme family)/thioredoxin reductase